MSEPRTITWYPGDPCPVCGNQHAEFRIEGTSDGTVAICPPSEPDRIRAEVANALLPGLQEAVKLEPDSQSLADRLATAERDAARGQEIVTPLSEVGQ